MESDSERDQSIVMESRKASDKEIIIQEQHTISNTKSHKKGKERKKKYLYTSKQHRIEHVIVRKPKAKDDSISKILLKLKPHEIINKNAATTKRERQNKKFEGTEEQR